MDTLAQTKQILKEFAENFTKGMQELRASQKETDRIVQENARQIKKNNDAIGAWGNNHGQFAEEYFFNAFEQGKTNFFGENFEDIKKNFKGAIKDLEDEYDIVLINGKSIGIIEVKYKAHKNDIAEVLRKAETFKILFPYYKDFKIYLGLASLAFYGEAENECLEQGIAVIKQVGDKVVINDKHLKVF